MNVLVTGGAGYIGSVTTRALVDRGDAVCVVDNLSTGHKGAVPAEIPFYQTSLQETRELEEILRAGGIEAIVHFAAYSLVGESVKDPEKYFRNNVAGTLSLLEAMNAAGVRQLVFSSTAAVYGEPESVPISEEHPTRPGNPYGLTKRFMEQAMESYAGAYGLRFAALRYFNACGAAGRLGEAHSPETHLIPLVLQVALGQRPSISIYGTDYDTPDGTCVRDYIHVLDLADAHLRALDHLARGGESLHCNLGNGRGFSVREVIETCREITGHEIPAEEGPRRPGDPSRLVADAAKARAVLGWQPERGGLSRIVSDAWEWHRTHPTGYKDA